MKVVHLHSLRRIYSVTSSSHASVTVNGYGMGILWKAYNWIWNDGWNIKKDYRQRSIVLWHVSQIQLEKGFCAYSYNTI